MARTQQPAFSSGELSPSLHARTDLQQFTTGVAKAENVFVKIYGGAANRPGTRFVGACHDHARRSRLIPFQFSTTQSYVLEFGHQVMRVYRNGAPVLQVDPAWGTVDEIVSIATPYTEGGLRRLRFAQSADTMYLVHPDVSPRTLVRLDHHAWELREIDIGGFAPYPKPGEWSLTTNGSGPPDPQINHVYVITYEKENGEESTQSAQKSISWTHTLTPSHSVNINVPAIPEGAALANVYKRRAGIFGWIGSTRGGTVIDDGRVPDLNETPPRHRNPFEGAGNYPGAVGFYQQRIAFGGSASEPDTLHLSQTGHYTSFKRSEPTRDDDAIVATLSSLQVNEIRHLVGMRSLLILTSGGVWSMKRGDRGLTPSLEGGIDLELGIGADQPPPIVVGSSCLFVQDKARVIRDLYYDVASDAYHGEEVSLLAEHLLRGDAVAYEWAYAAQPWSLLWIVRADGVLLSMAYHRDQRVFGWARHVTDGRFESIAAVSEGGEDAVYVIARRKVGGEWRRYVERFASRAIDDVRDGFFVDCGLSYDDPKTIAEVAPAGATTRLTVPGHGLGDGDLIDVEGVPGLDGRRLKVGIVDADRLNLYHDRAFDEDGSPAPIGPPEPDAYAGGGAVRRAVTRVEGLNHLIGREVTVLADGNVEGPYTVDGDGGVALARPASRVHAGIAYRSEIVTLPLPLPADPFAKRKRVLRLGVLVEQSRGLWAGPEGGSMVELKQRRDERWGEPTRPFSGRFDLPIPATWSDEGRFVIQQRDPLPMEILGLLPTFELGGG